MTTVAESRRDGPRAGGRRIAGLNGRQAAPDGPSTEAVDDGRTELGPVAPAALYANGQRFVRKGGPERKRFSDPDASWGHRSAVSTRQGAGFYGYRLHAAVCAVIGLPVAWQVDTAHVHESNLVAPLIDKLRACGFAVETCALDMGYDNGRVYAECEDRDVRPIIPLRETTAVARGDHKPPTCEHGEWRFAGSDFHRKAAKWRCPAGEYQPASRWITAYQLHPPADPARDAALAAALPGSC